VILREWAAQWNVPIAAVVDLERRMGLEGGAVTVETDGKSESWAQSVVRLEAPSVGAMLWRNNVGALQDETGRVVRYGLANDSAAVNKVIKSGDLIGVRKRVITPEMVGTTIGQFVSREMKPPGWHFTGTPRECAQLAFANLVVSYGGDAAFATGAGSFR
jgi:hypothetical protein